MPTLLDVSHLSKTYPSKEGSVSALCDLSLSIDEGEIFGIIGLSGAGKSTLIRCLAHLDTPTSGSIHFANQDICHMKKGELRGYRKQIGMIFQHFNLLSSRTVYDNIAYPLEIMGLSGEKQEERVAELLHLVGLSEKRLAYPSQLSGGEKQRVGIARALANRPKLLLCDEATSALDPKTTKEILALLRKLNRTLKLTIVLITHEMDVIKQIAGRVAVLDGGAIVETGPVSEVFADPKHPTTKSFLQQAHHELPAHIVKPPSEKRKLLRLSFKGESAKEPWISQMIRNYSVDANILMGWVDALETTTVGTLIIELTGEGSDVKEALVYLQKNLAHVEEIKAP